MADDAQGLEMLLESMLRNQEALSSDLRDAVRNMATKDDIKAIAASVALTVSSKEFDLLKTSVDGVGRMVVPRIELEARWKAYDLQINILEKRLDAVENHADVQDQSRLPRWFWPAVISMVTLAVPFLEYITLKH